MFRVDSAFGEFSNSGIETWFSAGFNCKTSVMPVLAG
jgi:hypothetical protein